MPIRGMEDKRETDKEKLKELAYVDDLTELYNRRYLYQYLPVELKQAQAAGKQLSLLMIDVDTFKEINDSYGHLCGDKILVGIAQILRDSLREGDTIVRYAGDEFIAILPGVEEDTAAEIAKRITQKVDKNPFRESKTNASIHATISIGLAFFPRDAGDPEKLIHQADRALYSSKRSGRNRICATKDISAEILNETKIQELFPTPELIGRRPQLDRLKELLDEAEKGKTKFALIKGERGIGKTRLINEFRKHAQEKGITNISATCSPEISNQPYQILIQALENLFASLGPEVREFIRSLPEAQTAQLANYIPALKKFLPPAFKTAGASTKEQAQIDLFKGICQSLIYVVKRNILLLIIDDFHWIDKGTLQLFNYIIKDLTNIPMLIVAAYRGKDLEKRTDDTALGELLQQIKQQELVDELTLELLEKEDILKMFTTIFAGIEPQAKFVDIVYDVSAGNPLFTEELFRSLVAKGFIFYQDRIWHLREVSETTLPSFLKESIQKMVTELDEETRPVISAAAVIGQVFNFDVLCQMLEKDSGYVLEVMDRAAKQHLILPESPFQSDKFKFNSGAIRDIIYNSLSPSEKQDLHRKLALIEESRHKDNIDSVAGSLGYHFGKAKDSEKENLYAQMLVEKTSRMPTYEDVFGFLQGALLEKVEEIVVPLSDAAMKLVSTMARSLRLAIQNVRLYPAHSTIRKGFVEQAHKNLSDILARDSTLIIGTAENRLLVNGEEVGEKKSREAGAAAFIGVMIDHRVKSIIFKKGLTKQHLVVLLEGLSQNFDELISEGGLSGLLRKNDISLIRVSDIRYEQTTKLTKQRTKFEEAMLIDYLIGKVSNLEGDNVQAVAQVANDPKKLAAALKKVAKIAKSEKGKDKTQAQANIIAQSLQKLSDVSQAKGGIEQYRKNIAQAMMALDYKLRSKVMQAQGKMDKTAHAQPKPKDLSKDAAPKPSDQDLLEMAIKELSASDGNLTNMRNVVRRLLSDSERKQRLLPALKTKLAQMGISEEEKSWVLGEAFWGGLSLKEKGQRAVKVSPQNYLKLQKEISEQIDKLIPELLENDQHSEAGEVIDKLLKQLGSESKELRSISIRDLGKISETLILKEKHFLLEQIISDLIARLNQEKDPQVYSSIVGVLANSCVKLIKKQDFIQATGILKEFNLRLEKSGKLPDIQKQAIKEARNKTVATTEVVKWLTELLEESIEAGRDFWELAKLICEIGPAAIEPLFDLAVSKDAYTDPFKAYALRWNIAKVLKSMGDEAVFYLGNRLADEKAELIKVTLQLLGHIQNENAVDYLQSLLEHKDPDIRKETVGILGKIGGEEAIKLLSECLKDDDSQIRSAAIWALGNIGTPEVLPLLKPLLKEEAVSGKVKKIIQRIQKK